MSYTRLSFAIFLFVFLGISACDNKKNVSSYENSLEVDFYDNELLHKELGEEREAFKGKDKDILKESKVSNGIKIKKAILADLRFEQLGQGENAIVADVEEFATIILKKESVKEYLLLLENADVSDNVEKFQSYTFDSGKIRSVRVFKEGEKVALRIFSDSELSFLVLNDKFIIKPAELLKNDNLNIQSMEERGKKAALNETKDRFEGLFNDSGTKGRLVSLDFQNADIETVLMVIAEISNKKIVPSADVVGKISINLFDVTWDYAFDMILKKGNLEKIEEEGVIRVVPAKKINDDKM